MSLVVLYKLLTECKRDIGLFARQSLLSISAALDVKVYQSNGKTDLESASRASNCFVALTQGTDGGPIGVDDTLTSAYVEVLNKFSSLATSTAVLSPSPAAPSAPVTSEKADDEDQSRARLIGLRGLTGAATSDAMFSSGSGPEFARQVKAIVPALLAILDESDVGELKALVKRSRRRSAMAPLITETPVGGRPRPPPSLSEHVVGEKGPSADDVSSAAFRCMYELVAECHTSQASHVLDVVLAYLDKRGGWRDVERCCLLAESLAQAMPLQTRFVVPTRLVELLVNMPDTAPPSDKHMSALAMVTTVLTSSVSLVGLAVTDILSSLISVIERRVAVDPMDALLPPLVSCVSSLGTHIYYVDQINDIVEETTLQMMTIPQSNPARQEILRVLIHCITGVMNAADHGDAVEAEARERPSSPQPKDKGKAPALESPAVEAPRARDAGRRNPIAPEVWQETLPLLCESTYPVRAAYARALLFYLRTELPRDKRPRPDEPNIVRFCNALNAAVYTLAMSSRLGVGEPLPSVPPTPTPGSSGFVGHSHGGQGQGGARRQGTDTPPKGAVTFTVQEPTPNETPAPTPAPASNDQALDANGGRSRSATAATAATATSVANGAATPGTGGSATPPRKPLRGGRRVSLPLNRLVPDDAGAGAFDAVATPADYAAIIRILDELHSAVPSAALETSAPMLFALDADAGSELVRRGGDDGAWVMERRRACRETLLVVWRHIAQAWGVEPVLALADQAIRALPEPFVVPDPLAPSGGDDILPLPDQPSPFARDETPGESAASTRPLLPPSSLIPPLSTAPPIQTGTGRDAPSLSALLGARWSVESAIQDSVERFSRHPAPAQTLMAIPNASYQSFGRPVSRAVDVGDLRDALSGGEPVGASSAAQSVASTNISAPTGASAAASPKKGRPDPQEILKEIFREKKPRAQQGQGQEQAVSA